MLNYIYTTASRRFVYAVHLLKYLYGPFFRTLLVCQVRYLSEVVVLLQLSHYRRYQRHHGPLSVFNVLVGEDP